MKCPKEKELNSFSIKEQPCKTELNSFSMNEHPSSKETEIFNDAGDVLAMISSETELKNDPDPFLWVPRPSPKGIRD